MSQLAFTMYCTTDGLSTALRSVAQFIDEKEIEVSSFTVKQDKTVDPPIYVFEVHRKEEGAFKWLIG